MVYVCLRDYVDDELARFADVAEGVFGFAVGRGDRTEEDRGRVAADAVEGS